MRKLRLRGVTYLGNVPRLESDKVKIQTYIFLTPNSSSFQAECPAVLYGAFSHKPVLSLNVPMRNTVQLLHFRMRKVRLGRVKIYPKVHR